MFFGASGSIAGGTMWTPPSMPVRHVAGDVEERRRVAAGRTAAAAPSSPGSASRRRCGSARSSPPPSPARAMCSAAGCGSWTMHTSQPSRQLARVHLVVLRPRRPLLLGEVLRVALQRVVHELRRVEELLAPVDHLPLDLEPDVAHERHERVEDLRDAAAERGGGEVHDAPARQRLGQLAHLLDERAADDVRVVGEALVGEGDGLEHGRRGRYPERRALSPRPQPRERPVAELDPHVAALAVAPGLHRDRRARVEQRDRAREVVRVVDRPAVDRGDHVAARAVAADLERRSRRRRRRAARPSSAGPSADDVLHPRALARPAGRSARAAAGRSRRSRRRGRRTRPRRRRAAARARAGRRRPGPRSRRPRRRRSSS